MAAGKLRHWIINYEFHYQIRRTKLYWQENVGLMLRATESATENSG